MMSWQNNIILYIYIFIYIYVTFGNIYQKSYHCLCPHVDPHLSPPTAQQWVSMCIRLICVHIDHLEVLVGIEME